MKRILIPLRRVVATAGLICSGIPAPAQAYDITATHMLATQAQAASVLAYWLKDNGRALATATPYGMRTTITARHVSNGGPASDGEPGLVPAIDDAKKSSAKSKNVNLPRTAGKAFFVGADDRPHWCTATSVQADYRNLVATAGHCVYGTEPGAATVTHWIFVPGYYQGAIPWGVYVGRQAFTHHDLATYGDVDRDYAFVSVYNGLAPSPPKSLNQAQYISFTGGLKYKVTTGDAAGYRGVRLTDVGRLGDRVGGQGLAYNLQVGRPVFIFGYPNAPGGPGGPGGRNPRSANGRSPAGPSAPGAGGPRSDGDPASSGHTLRWSYGRPFKAQDLAIKAEELVGMRTTFTGAAGSSWLVGYKNTRRLGYLNGVTIGVSNSNGVSGSNGGDRADIGVSPYFDGELFGVYNAARHLWSGSIAFDRAFEMA